jgi:hypothetical protein
LKILTEEGVSVEHTNYFLKRDQDPGPPCPLDHMQILLNSRLPLTFLSQIQQTGSHWISRKKGLSFKPFLLS